MAYEAVDVLAVWTHLNKFHDLRDLQTQIDSSLRDFEAKQAKQVGLVKAELQRYQAQNHRREKRAADLVSAIATLFEVEGGALKCPEVRDEPELTGIDKELKEACDNIVNLPGAKDLKRMYKMWRRVMHALEACRDTRENEIAEALEKQRQQHLEELSSEHSRNIEIAKAMEEQRQQHLEERRTALQHFEALKCQVPMLQSQVAKLTQEAMALAPELSSVNVVQENLERLVESATAVDMALRSVLNSRKDPVVNFAPKASTCSETNCNTPGPLAVTQETAGHKILSMLQSHRDVVDMPEPQALSTDEYMLWLMTEREDAEIGADSRNKETFGEDVQSRWTFQENLTANEMIERRNLHEKVGGATNQLSFQEPTPAPEPKPEAQAPPKPIPARSADPEITRFPESLENVENGGIVKDVGGIIEIVKKKYGCVPGQRFKIIGSSNVWQLKDGKTVPKEHVGDGWKWIMNSPTAEKPAEGKPTHAGEGWKWIMNSPRTEKPAEGKPEVKKYSPQRQKEIKSAIKSAIKAKRGEAKGYAQEGN